MDSLQETLNCPVCFEEFEEDGDRVPRLLPCSHTLCHTCMDQCIRDNRLECPTCRIRHEVGNEEMSFPQNKYILTMVRRRSRLEGGEIEEYRRCPDHGQNENLSAAKLGARKPSVFCASPKPTWGTRLWR